MSGSCNTLFGSYIGLISANVSNLLTYGNFSSAQWIECH